MDELSVSEKSREKKLTASFFIIFLANFSFSGFHKSHFYRTIVLPLSCDVICTDQSGYV